MTGVQIVNAVGECEAEAGGPMAFLVTIAQVARFANEFFEWLKLRHKFVVLVAGESIEQIRAILMHPFEISINLFTGTAGVPPACVRDAQALKVKVNATWAGGTPAVPETRLRSHW